MSHPAIALLVRVRSSQEQDEVLRVMERRAPDFRALKGLRQKYYLQDAESGEFAGLYLWDSPEAMAEYRDSELRASIAASYCAEGEIKVEVYRVLMSLRDAP